MGKMKEKGYASNPEELPAGPLKNYHTGYLADPKRIRDTPLVPKGTVADMYMRTLESVFRIFILCASRSGTFRL